MASGSTGADLIEFLNDRVRHRALAPQTGADYILACTDILAVAEGEDWRAVDVAGLNLDDVRGRLIEQKGAAPLARFHERFEPAVHLFLEHLGVSRQGAEEPPEAPDPAPPPRARRPRRTVPAPPRRPTPTPLPKVVPMASTPSLATPTLLPHLFPVRPGVLAALCLPSDLTAEEAERLARYVESLAVPATATKRAPVTADVNGQ